MAVLRGVVHFAFGLAAVVVAHVGTCNEQDHHALLQTKQLLAKSDMGLMDKEDALAANSDTGKGLRLVYLDMGANWANTMRLCLDLESKQLKEPIAKAAEPFGGVTRPWEVYSFEAMPEIQVYIESVILWIEGRGPQPAVPFPPSGSSVDWGRFLKSFECGDSHCLSAKAEKGVQRWKEAVPDRLHQLGLDSNATLTERLEMARSPVPVGSSPRYTLVPAGVSDKFQYLQTNAFNVGASARGGIRSDENYLKTLRKSDPKETITLIDSVSWILEHFSPDDFVVVKMDVEGAEFQVLPPLLASTRNPMKMLLWECHEGRGGSCPELKDLVKTSKIPSFMEGSGYQGFDSYSRPEDFLIDPQFEPRVAWFGSATKYEA